MAVIAAADVTCWAETTEIDGTYCITFAWVEKHVDTSFWVVFMNQILASVQFIIRVGQIQKKYIIRGNTRGIVPNVLNCNIFVIVESVVLWYEIQKNYRYIWTHTPNFYSTIYLFHKNMITRYWQYWFKWLYIMMVRLFANGPEDRGSIPGRVIPKTQKWYLIPPALTLIIIRYGLRVSGAPRERSNVIPYTSV